MLEERRRKRVVFYRITEDEYAIMQDMCSSIGARTVSELTRFAVQEFIGHGAARTGENLHEQMRTLAATLDEIGKHVQDIACRIKSDAPAPGEESGEERGDRYEQETNGRYATATEGEN